MFTEQVCEYSLSSLLCKLFSPSFMPHIQLCQMNVIPLSTKPYVNEVTFRESKNDPYDAASLLTFVMLL